ncbi:MAG TPA: hypothetical protein VF316_21280 [Polyangiaceae bacterium]
MKYRALAWLTLPLGAALAALACVGDATPAPAEISCSRYCSDIATVCTGDNVQFTDTPTCNRFCGQMTLGTLNSGDDSVACRLTNVSNAKEPGSEHDSCIFAGVATNCGTGNGDKQCDAFCKLDRALCGDLAYKSQAECATACAAWSKVFTGPTIGSTGNTLQCRVYHLQLSQTGNEADRVTHCPHTLPTSAKCNDAKPADGGTDAAPADAGGGG